MKPILILTAVDGEARPIQSLLYGTKSMQVAGLPVIRGYCAGQRVYLFTSGPGTFNTAARLSVLLSRIHPKLILQAGCGGMYPGSGLVMGGLAVATMELDLHTGLESPSVLPSPLPFSLLDNGPHRPGLYPAHESLVRSAMAILRNENLNPVSGPFVTLSCVSTSGERATAIREETGAIIENMEGAAAFHTAALYHIPILELRSVSNPAGTRRKEDWDLKTAFLRAAEGVGSLLKAAIQP
ncbi:futalosine hydrolase [Desulfobotulus sp. H1]|uniref:Futalosine hydrolase n=1 Tax=Desulfobotulus pelophilus TaxID=2823377 RepID=A0ABT3N8H2_9BACT|nr:futalosine hydrolase [Desulfobotulus pelophilus]MCW7753754.1 futalosine hydrolase [Desulfobotulus pelophilus]